MARLKVPEGWCAGVSVHAEPDPDAAPPGARHFALAVRHSTGPSAKADIMWRADGTSRRSRRCGCCANGGIRSKTRCVSTRRPQVWWPECSKEAYADGGRGRCVLELASKPCRETGWQNSRRSRFKKKGRGRRSRVTLHDRCDACGARPPPPHLAGDRHQFIRNENTCRAERLIAKGRAWCWRSPRRNRTRLDASAVLNHRPQQRCVWLPDSRVGVAGGGVWPLSQTQGTVEQAPNPRPLDAAKRVAPRQPRTLTARKAHASHCERTTELSRLHRRVNGVRTHHLHVLTTLINAAHGRIVVEGLMRRECCGKGDR